MSIIINGSLDYNKIDNSLERRAVAIFTNTVAVSGADLTRIYDRFGSSVPWPYYHEWSEKYVDDRSPSTVYWFGDMAKFIVANLE